jgi:phosphopantetheinyl transferase (holo-ACP synthase)
METEMIYWRHDTPIGVRVEEISGGEDKSPRLWSLLAQQIYSESDKEGYRVIEHYPNGAPYIDGSNQRISVSHTPYLMVIATLPRTGEVDLSAFSPRAAMGIDVERHDRQQVLKLRAKFLSDAEQAMIPADSVEANITAWTCKEALFKAALQGGEDWTQNYTILQMPDPDRDTLGKAEVRLSSGDIHPFELYSYRSDDYIVTIAISPKCATFKKMK